MKLNINPVDDDLGFWGARTAKVISDVNPLKTPGWRAPFLGPWSGFQQISTSKVCFGATNGASKIVDLACAELWQSTSS